MKILRFSLLLFIIINLIYSCNKSDDNVPCPKVDSIYFRLDSMAISLVKIYHPGDTLKLKNPFTGIVYLFTAQNPDSGYFYEKDPASIEYNCPGNDWFLGYYSIRLKPLINNISPIDISVLFNGNGYYRFKVDFNGGYYETPSYFPLPPSTPSVYKDSVFVNGKLYRHVATVSYRYDINLGFIYYNRTNGLIKLVFDGTSYELLQ